MTIFTYARLSKLDTITDIQTNALTVAYPNGIYKQEIKSDTRIKGKPALNNILDTIEPGDKLVTWKLDRLAQNIHDLAYIIETLNNKGADLEILDQKIDTSTATGKAFLQMLDVFAEFESNCKKERQRIGIAAAKAKGKHMGRKASLTNKQKQEIRTKNKKGMNASTLSREYQVSRGTICNALKEIT